MARSLALLALLPAACAGAGNARDRDAVRAAFTGSPVPVHAFDVGHLVVGAAVDDTEAARVRRYLGTLLASLGPQFQTPAGRVRVHVVDTREQLAPVATSVCGAPPERGREMGFYHEPTRSVFCSLQWGLGWLGDLVIRSYLADDWKAARPNLWFQPSFVSMLYNSFRTPQGDFCGLNVMSYYRPQVQRMIAERRILPMRRFLRDEWDRALLADDSIRKQGREFLAWLHAQGLLAGFTRIYRETCAADPSGIRAVEETMGKPLEQVEEAWLAWMQAADGEIGDSEMAKPFPVLGILVVRKTTAILEVCPGSPAQRGGLQRGDAILAIGDRSVASLDEVIACLGAQAIGAVVAVRIRRGTGELALDVTLDRFIDG